MNEHEQLLAEGVARAMSRRRLLRRASETMFAVVSGAAISGIFNRPARAHTYNGQSHCYYQSGADACSPPHQTFCSGCNGHACPSGYYWTEAWGYFSACWCTNVTGTSYSVCCDCSQTQYAVQRYDTDCGCFSVERILQPDA
jgi:hypothetical protein